jgi:hypothetical protein
MGEINNFTSIEDDLIELYHDSMRGIEDEWFRIMKGTFKRFKVTEYIFEHIAYEYLTSKGIDEGIAEVGDLLRYCNGKKVNNTLLRHLIDGYWYYIPIKRNAIKNDRAAAKSLEDRLWKAEMHGHQTHRRNRYRLVHGAFRERGLTDRMIRYVEREIRDEDYESYAKMIGILLTIFATKECESDRTDIQVLLGGLRRQFPDEMKRLKL